MRFGTKHSFHEFHNEERFRRAVNRFRLRAIIGFDEANDILEHEKAHFEKAKELGYHPFYKISIAKTYFFGYVIGAQIAFITNTLEEISREDRAKIALAPRVPSIEDLATAEKAGAEAEAQLAYVKYYGGHF